MPRPREMPLSAVARFRFLAACLAGLFALFAAPGTAQETVYRLMVNDQIQVQVVEWRPEIGAPQTWDGLSGAYTVDPSGRILVPLAGSIEAAGRTPDEVAGLVAAGIQKAIGLVDPPGTAVEVLAYNPVYVVGQVANPGAQPYTPGLRAAAAFALAGGEPEVLAADIRASARAAGAVARAQETLARLLARESRLVAERDGFGGIEFPNRLGHPGGDLAELQIKQTESALFDSRREQFSRQLTGMRDLQQLYLAEEASLSQKRVSLDAEIVLVEERLGKLQELSEDGLVRGQQLLDIQRAMGDLRTQSLDIDLALFRAQANLSVVNRDLEAVQTTRTAEIATMLADTRAEITTARRELSTNRTVLNTFTSDAPFLRNQGLDSALQFELQRVGSDQIVVIAPETLLVPGDVLTVSRVEVANPVDTGTGDASAAAGIDDNS